MKKIYHYIKLVNDNFWHRIAQSTLIEERSLGIFRWIFGFFLLLFFVPQFSWISQVPDAFFNPLYLTPTNLLAQFPGYIFFTIITLLTITSIVFLTIGIKARLFNIVLLICWFIGNSFQYSFGKIDHDIMVLALLLCMLFSNWGTYYALLPDKPLGDNYSKQALALFSVLLAFGFITAGLAKAIIWVDFDFSTNGFLSWFYRGYYNLNRNDLLAPIILYLPKWIFEFFDYAAVVFELSAFIALLSSRKWWLVWLLIACLFHLSNTLLLNIPFMNYFLVYLVFVDFSLLLDWVNRKVGLSTAKHLNYFLTGLVLCLSLPYFLGIISGKTVNFLPDTITRLYASIFIWIVGAIIIASNLLIVENKSAIGIIQSMKKSIKR